MIDFQIISCKVFDEFTNSYWMECKIWRSLSSYFDRCRKKLERYQSALVSVTCAIKRMPSVLLFYDAHVRPKVWQPYSSAATVETASKNGSTVLLAASSVGTESCIMPNIKIIVVILENFSSFPPFDKCVFRNYRREVEINPVHDLLLAARAAQIERQQQAQNQWFQRHAVQPSSLVGLDVVSGRRTTPLVIYPHYHHLLESSFMVGFAAEISCDTKHQATSLFEVSLFRNATFNTVTDLHGSTRRRSFWIW